MNPLTLGRWHPLVTLAAWGILLASLCIVTEAQAHAVGENYVFIAVHETVIKGHVEIHFDDLKQKLNIDAQELAPAAALALINQTAPTVHDYIRQHLSIGANGQTFDLEFTHQGVLEVLGNFAQYYFTCPIDAVPDLLNVKHEMLYENDRFHRGLLVVSFNAKTGTEYDQEHAALVFSKTSTQQQLDLRQNISGLLRPGQFIWQGVLHIWVGIDHILFLVVLLLPVVLRREEGQWIPLDSFSKAVWNVVKIVTLFTVAHSITLSLAAIDVIQLPTRLVESVIAASIILVAVNNIVPTFKESSALIIFAFGLFHGMGFASVMGELPFRVMHLVKVILYFNLGVEIGQLVIVVAAFAILFGLRTASQYRPVCLIGGSATAALVAAVWFVQRAFGL